MEILPTLSNLSERAVLTFIVIHGYPHRRSWQKGGHSSLPAAVVFKALSQESPEEMEAADI